METVKRFFAFWYDFLIGDDLVGGLIVLAGFVATYFVAQAGITAYWIVMAAVLISLSWNLWRRSNGASKSEH